MGANREKPMGELLNGPIPDPRHGGLVKSAFQISANRLEVDEKVQRTHWLALRGAMHNRTAFAKGLNE